MDKLVEASFICGVNYLDWLSNMVLIKKANRRWFICIDYINLNKPVQRKVLIVPDRSTCWSHLGTSLKFHGCLLKLLLGMYPKSNYLDVDDYYICIWIKLIKVFDSSLFLHLPLMNSFYDEVLGTIYCW